MDRMDTPVGTWHAASVRERDRPPDRRTRSSDGGTLTDTVGVWTVVSLVTVPSRHVAIQQDVAPFVVPSLSSVELGV